MQATEIASLTFLLLGKEYFYLIHTQLVLNGLGCSTDYTKDTLKERYFNNTSTESIALRSSLDIQNSCHYSAVTHIHTRNVIRLITLNNKKNSKIT